MEKLKNDASLEEIIAKVNELIEKFEEFKVEKPEEMYIAPNVKSFYDELGGKIQ